LRLLPEVIDTSIIPTVAGVFSIAFITDGALRGVEPERLARLSLGGMSLAESPVWLASRSDM
jgi:hypothetical protein